MPTSTYVWLLYLCVCGCMYVYVYILGARTSLCASVYSTPRVLYMCC
jgi:hypothetical protein